MNQHLSVRQIDEWLIGARTPEVAAHLQRCNVCAEELRRFTDPLSLFRESVRTWSFSSSARDLPCGTGHRFFWPLRRREATRWVALAFAALLAIIAVPFYHYEEKKSQSAQDELLLRRVESHIAQSVPAPMEPLAQLMQQELR